jgi:hypothetical protein
MPADAATPEDRNGVPFQTSYLRSAASLRLSSRREPARDPGYATAVKGLSSCASAHEISTLKTTITRYEVLKRSVPGVAPWLRRPARRTGRPRRRRSRAPDLDARGEMVELSEHCHREDHARATSIRR